MEETNKADRASYIPDVEVMAVGKGKGSSSMDQQAWRGADS